MASLRILFRGRQQLRQVRWRSLLNTCEALQAAGFSVVAERNRRDFALAFFDQLRARTAAGGSPPALGLHILMGRNTPDKVQNMIQNISSGCIAPVELIARKV